MNFTGSVVVAILSACSGFADDKITLAERSEHYKQWFTRLIEKIFTKSAL